MVVDIFSNEYLRSLNNEYIARLLTHGERHGFPRMLRSINCMNWKWKNCSTAWKCHYCGHIRKWIIILKAMVSYGIWIWHAIFRLGGSNNNINLLQGSPIFFELVQGHASAVNCLINGNDYTMGHYLTDSICPKWSTFMKTIPTPQTQKRQLIAKAKEVNKM